MYKIVNSHLRQGNIANALEVCIKEKYYNLGTLLGFLSEQKENSALYHQYYGQLLGIIQGEVRPQEVRPQEVRPQEERPQEVRPQEVRPQEVPQKTIEIPQELPSDMSRVLPSTTLIPLELYVSPPRAKTIEKSRSIRSVKVKLLCNWMTTADIIDLWNKMGKEEEKGRWNNVQLIKEGEPDYYVVVNCPPINEFPPPEKTIQLRMEPYMEKHPEMWGAWALPDENRFVKICYHNKEYNNVEWHLSKTYSQLKSEKIEKDRELDRVVSTVLSEKYKDPGHIKRIDFVKFLEKKGFAVHVYGSNKWRYKDYKGTLPYHTKDQALLPYKYTFNVENHSIANYFTEKLIDGILSECLVFYSGCYNVGEYFDKRAFVYLELIDFEKDYQTIKKAIEENWWQKRLPYIRGAKKRILEHFQFFPRIERIIFEHENRENLDSDKK